MTYYIDIEGQKVEVPKWARWLTQDEDGAWFVHSTKPQLGKYGPYWRGGHSCRRIGLVKNWKSQLYEIVRK